MRLADGRHRRCACAPRPTASGRNDHAEAKKATGEKGHISPPSMMRPDRLIELPRSEHRASSTGSSTKTSQPSGDTGASRPQHLAAEKILRLLHRTSLPRTRRRDLGEPRHVGAYEDKADVRCAIAGVAVDDIGDASRDLDLAETTSQIRFRLTSRRSRRIAAGAGERRVI